MGIDARISTRLRELHDLGEKVLASRREPSPGHITSDFVDVQLANQWFTSCLSLFLGVFGSEGVHYQRFAKLFVDYPKWPHVQQAFGVLLAATEDFEKEALFNVKRVVEAELFSDFLELAEYLSSTGYYQPAAVIAGSVLEDGLRKLCSRSGVQLPDRPKLDWMNAQLAKAGTYNVLTQKRITALADLRNSAAHGKWDQFQQPDVDAMIRDVRDFMEHHYA